MVLVHLRFGSLLLIANLFEFGDILEIVFLLIANFEELPAIIILAQFNAGIPFGADSDHFMLEQGHKLTFYFFSFR